MIYTAKMGENDKKHDLGTGLALPSRLGPGELRPDRSGVVDDERSPMAMAFNRAGEKNLLPSSLPFMGTAPVSYTAYLGQDGQMHLDGKRGIEYRLEGGDVRFLAGSYIPGQRVPGVEHWTAEVAWTPINMSGLKMGPLLGDVARTELRGGGFGFDRIGPSVGLYATTDDKQGGLFAKVQTDPDNGNSLKAFIGVKLPLKGP